MTILTFLDNKIEAYATYLPFIFFLANLLWIIFFKTAAKKNSYAEINKIHFKFGMLYFFLTVIIALITNQLHTHFLIGLIIGIYIYISLHYIFTFQLIGLCKKSISIAIVNIIFQSNKNNIHFSEKSLIKEMKKSRLGIEEIRESRLDQMLQLGFAKINGSRYQIKFFGKVVHKISDCLLKALNFKRL